MQCRWIVALLCAGLCIQTAVADHNAPVRLRRQDSVDSSFPSLTSSNPGSAPSTTPASSSATTTTPASSSNAGSSSVISHTQAPGSSSSSPSSHSPLAASNSTRSHTATASTPVASSPTSTSTPIPGSNGKLPLPPRITPALSIGGVVLILTGATYTLVGIKNRWIQIFLSTAYLVSVSVTVLIDYVMHPPVSNAIQGAYFVAIFMTGSVGGAAALIFKEITEGLGCLLGGFCVGMWFMTLRPGGLVHSSVGTGILIAIFCVVAWAFSFSHHTRPHALIGATSFAGATAFTLGVDCFTRAGLKEFWLYIWNLNQNLFPLNTTTYPITRGIRVEIAVIVVVSMLGIISQLKLWKRIKARRDEKEATRLDEESRRDAVDEALGRHLERQNQRARQQWEMIYGDPNKGSRISMVDSVMEPDDGSGRASMLNKRRHSALSTTDTVEMKPYAGSRRGLQNKRESTITVTAIPEVDEGQGLAEPSKRSGATYPAGLENARNDDLEAQARAAVENQSSDSSLQSTREPSLTKDMRTNEASSVATTAEADPNQHAQKRGSFHQFWKRLSGHSSSEQPPSPVLQSFSQEALVMPQMHHSRASSLAATIDGDADRADPGTLGTYYGEATQPPAIVVSPWDAEKKKKPLADTPSPPELATDFDPEELARNKPTEATPEVASKPTFYRMPESHDDLQADKVNSESKHSSIEPPAVPGTKISLTPGALESVPSQLSNVVLSYRTNEWAKHISTADDPVFEEPGRLVADGEDELATQVISSTASPLAETHTPIEKRSPVEKATSESPSAMDHTLSAATKPPKPHILPQTQSTKESAISPESGSLQADPLRLNKSTGDLSQSASSSARPSLSTGHGLRSTSTPVLSQSMVSSPIDENAETIFSAPVRSSTTPMPTSAAVLAAQRQNLIRNNSTASLQQRPSTAVTYGSPSAADPASLSAVNLRRSASGASYTTDNASRRTSGFTGAVARLDTRMSSYDSRQPQRQSTAPTLEQREKLLAQWRTSMRQDVAVDGHPEQSLAQRRAEMLAAKQQSRQSQQQQQYANMHKENAMDQAMRRGDMQQLHREAMRKMQASANKHIK